MRQHDFFTKLLDKIILERKRMRRELLSQENLADIRIAVLGGSTTNEVVDMFEILLLRDGFRPTFYQSDYGLFYEEAVLDPGRIMSFKPDIVYIHTCAANISQVPPVSCSEAELSGFVDAELSRYRAIWESLSRIVDCQIIQNNFELPALTRLGNLDASSPGGLTQFTCELNRQFALQAAVNPRVILQDLCSISARIGLDNWYDADRWFSYKLPNTVEGSFAIAWSLCALVRAIYGRTRKVLVLDLDNTLWGGIIGDDGPESLVLGRETPVAEAYTAFQTYCLSLRDRGVLLAVCSKNDEQVAKQGFALTDSVLKLEHFSAFKANWRPKHENILEIADELRLGTDSFVFVDDNPAERAIVEAQIPGVAVPDVGSEVSSFAVVIEANRYFEQLTLSKEDLVRAALYADNKQRATLQSKFANYGEYLDSLEMSAEIDRFVPTYLERIAQLTNKSNQFNLTTRRYTLAEITAIASDPQFQTVYGRLADRFGDNGLVSVIIGRVEGDMMYVDLWLMSCRVLKREMEIAMLDSLVERARRKGLHTLIGTYLPTAKNGMVADHYQRLGFLSKTTEQAQGATAWSLDITNYEMRSRHIKISKPVPG